MAPTRAASSSTLSTSNGSTHFWKIVLPEAVTGIAATATVGYLGFLAGPPLIGFAAEAATLGAALGLLVLACGLVGAFASVARAADAQPAAAPAAPVPSG